MNIKLFTGNDLDGIGCAVLAKLIWRDSVNIEYSESHSSNIKDIIDSGDYNNYDKIFIINSNILSEDVKRISNINKRYDDNKFIVIADHNRPFVSYSGEMLTEYCVWATIESRNEDGSTTCATELFWRHLLKNYVRQTYDNDATLRNCLLFVEIIREWCTCEETNDNRIKSLSSDMYVLFNEYEKEYFVDIMVSRIVLSNGDLITSEDYNLLKVLDRKKMIYLKKKNTADISCMQTMVHGEMYTVGIVFADDYLEDVGIYICEENPDFDIIITVSLSEKIACVSSTKKGIDVQPIIDSMNSREVVGNVVMLNQNPINLFITNLFNEKGSNK